MNSDESDSEEEKKDDGVVLPQVVDYYKKFAQSRRLPAYFRGTTPNRPELIGQENTSAPVVITVDEAPRAESPGSSIASTNKSKLEWDNGADIGYENAEKDPSRFSPEGQKIDSSPQQQQSSSDSGDNKKIIYATTSESEVKVDSDSDAAVKLNFQDSLKMRIGIPVAESTPVNKNETPVLRKKYTKTKNKRSTSCEDLTSSKSECTIKKWSSQQDVVESRSVPLRKVINLCPTKPTVIECISKKSQKDKYTQTILPKNVSTAAQTDNKEIVRSSEKSENPRTAVVYSQHSDLDMNSENKSNSSTQTDSEVCVSKCNSFEFLSGETLDQNQENPVLKRTEAKTNLTENENGQGDGSSRSSSVFLGDIVTKKYSRDLINDLDHTIALIQKLANSKRYDEITKRFYLKKIVEKIVNNCYSEDSSGNETKKSSHTPRNAAEEHYLQGNVPWQPVQKTIEKMELKMQTFINEFVPEKTNSEDSAATKKKSPFTLCHGNKLAKNTTVHSSSGDAPNNSNTYSSSLSSDWREQKTLSERLLEEQKNSTGSSNGDHLVSFAKKERENQLTWINNEIVHLNKLKKLLEDKKKTKNLRNVASVALQPHVEDIAARKKSTTVYMITTERSDESTSSSNKIVKFCSCSRCSNQQESGTLYTAGSGSLKVNSKTCSCPSTQVHKTPCNCITKSVPFDLKNARLVSNEVFTTNSEKGKTTTAVSRYTFEIPVEKKGMVLKSVNNIEVASKEIAAGSCCPCVDTKSQTIGSARSDAGVIAVPVSSDHEVQSNVLQADKNAATEERASTSKQSSLSQNPDTVDKQSKTDQIPRSVSATQTQSSQNSKICQTCGCLLQKPSKETRCMCTQTSSPTGSQRRSVASSAGSPSKRSVATGAKAPCDCCNKTAACQCNLKEGQKCECASPCNPVGDSGTQFRGSSSSSRGSSRDAQTGVSLKERKPTGCSCSSTSTLSTPSSSGSSEFRLCPCCKLNKVAVPSERSVTNSKPSTNYILCYPCYQQCEKTTKPGTRPYFTYPGHICNCYTLLKTSAVNEIRKTVQDLEKLETKEELCKCAIGKSSTQNKDYCEYCNCKLQKARKGSSGIAYTLTIESSCAKPESPKSAKKLPEIKIKVPDVRCRKERKDKENQNKSKKNYNQTSSLTLQVLTCVLSISLGFK